jgi:hypothetical protein
MAGHRRRDGVTIGMRRARDQDVGLPAQAPADDEHGLGDPYDEKVFLPFAKEVETSEVLRMLLVLTIADIAAVGPGVLTKWKESLLIQLYLRTLPALSGEQDKTVGPERLKGIG